MFKSSHRPDGKIADMLAWTLACITAAALVNYSRYVPQRPKFSIAPMGKCLSDMPNSTLAVLGSNLVLPGIRKCQPRLQNAYSPDGNNIADVLALTHACTTANASVDCSMYVPERS
jgi:hypothetical protein